MYARVGRRHPRLGAHDGSGLMPLQDREKRGAGAHRWQEWVGGPAGAGTYELTSSVGDVVAPLHDHVTGDKLNDKLQFMFENADAATTARSRDAPCRRWPASRILQLCTNHLMNLRNCRAGMDVRDR